MFGDAVKLNPTSWYCAQQSPAGRPLLFALRARLPLNAQALIFTALVTPFEVAFIEAATNWDDARQPLFLVNR